MVSKIGLRVAYFSARTFTFFFIILGFKSDSLNKSLSNEITGANNQTKKYFNINLRLPNLICRYYNERSVPADACLIENVHGYHSAAHAFNGLKPI